ncbi:MAG TPA: hypothetical protein VGO48_12440 [Conexibacter sp.]|nr:hypothetical protein [Conexibacter sp.]
MPRARVLAPTEVAWIVAVPCALVALAAILALGPALGHALFRPVPAGDGLWPPGWRGAEGKPEPVELGRYLVAAAAPPLAAVLVLVLARRQPMLPTPLIRPLVLASQVLATAFVAFAFLGQHEVVFADRPLPSTFGVGTLLAAAGLLLAALAVLRRRDVAERLARLVRETPGRRRLGVALALAVSVSCLLQGLFVDGAAEDRAVFAFTVNDAFAVLDGRTPLVDYHLLYAKLLPYPAALAMAIFGDSALVYGLLMLLLSALALLAVYAIFRRILSSSLLALGLFVPFLALGDIGNSMLLTAMWPMRYGGAYLMAWLVARNVDHGRGRVWPLFAVGAVVAVNETEFGVAALVASLVALVCARPPRSRRAALSFALDAAGGVVAGLALVTLLTLLRAGSLPDPTLLDEWPRIFTTLGWFSMPMPAVSLHLALYVTFAACLLVAAVRLARADEDRLLTSMLAWSGVFGLLAGSYYTGRSDDLKLVSMFSAWAFALALLTVVAARGLAVQGWRRPSLPQLLVLFGFALAISSVVRLPPPQRELSRMLNEPPATYRPAAELFIDRFTRPHEKVAILAPMGHRFAYDLGLENVFPYPTPELLVTRWQLQTTLDVVRREHVHRIFVFGTFTTPEQAVVLQRAGFRSLDQFGELIALGN